MTLATANSHSGILMILSPAKTLDLSTCEKDTLDWTKPKCTPSNTEQVAKIMKAKEEKDLIKFLKISSNLAQAAHQYWTNFELDQEERDASEKKPCLFAFSGAAYQGLQASSLSDPSILYLQNNLRIIDPVYGVLRPLDVMQPYRLEMATPKFFPDDEKMKLSEFWKPSVSMYLNDDLKPRKEKIVLNLASDEYAAAVDPFSLQGGSRFIKVIFQQEGRVISVHAKRARGLMARYLADNQVQTLEEIQEFNHEGYAYQEGKSDDSTMVFDRPKQQTASSAKKRPQAASSSRKRTRTKK